MIRFQNPRERLLAVLFAGSLGFVFLWKCTNQWVLVPLQRKQAAITAMKSRIQDLEFQQLQVRRAQRMIADSAQTGLAADPMIGSLEYQQWLVESTRAVSLQNVFVSPGRPIEEEFVGSRIPFSMTCTATFLSVVQWMERFQETTAFHRISQMSLTPAGQSDSDLLNVSVQIEVMALVDGPEKSLLGKRRDASLASYGKLKLLASSTEPFRRKSKSLERRSFSTEPSTAKSDEQNAADPGPSQVMLIACGTRDRKPEAWLYREGEQEPIRLQVEELIQIGEKTLKVHAIQTDSILVEVDEKEHLVQLGEPLDF